MKKGALKLISIVLSLAISLWSLPLAFNIVSAENTDKIYASSHEVGYEAENAINNDFSDYWMTEEEQGTLTLDLGKVYRVTGYKQFFRDSDVWFFAVKGSLDNDQWVDIANYDYGVSGKAFADSVDGFYRYVKLEVYGSENNSKITSSEFIVDRSELSDGTNVALGLKGYSSSWSGGFEHEKAFDGDVGSYYCANNGNFPQYCGVNFNYSVYAKSVEIYLKDYDTYDFEITAKTLEGTTEQVVARKARTGSYFIFYVSGEYVSFEYKVYSAKGWANLVEMNVNGFKDLTDTECAQSGIASTSGDYHIYSFPYGVYVDKCTDSEAYISNDGKSWEKLSKSADTVCKYVRTSLGNSARVYGTPLVKDLAQGIKGSVSDYSNEDYSAIKCTTNPEHEDGKNAFWCAESYNGVHWLQIDLGNVCYVEKVIQRFQDNGSYRFKIEGSLDGSTYVTIYDTVGRENGQSFECETDNQKYFRYIRLTETDCGWANSNQFQIIGYGEPIRESWWRRESGVVRYYPKEQKVTINEMIDKLDYYRQCGFKVIEVHQPYEGVGDIWSGLGATDNYNADPINGTLDDWAYFLDKAHSLGMYVFMFGNVGYARSSAEFFKKACLDYANGIDSEERNWFLFSDTCPDSSKWFWSDLANAYYYGYWGENGQIPNYNFDTEEWRTESRNYVTFWADFGFDGVALDAPPAYYYGSQNAATVTYNSITKPLSARNVMILPEGTGDYNYIYSYHYNAVQNYNMGQWGGGAWSLGIDAVTDCNATTIDDFIKSGRDNAVALGGTAIAPLCFEQKYENVEDYKRIAEAALLTTSGHMAFLHSGSSAFIGQDIIDNCSEYLKESVFSLFALQNSYSAFNASGLRNRIPTNNDNVYYAYSRTDVSGHIKAVVIFNYSDSTNEITVNLDGTGMSGRFINLISGEKLTANGSIKVTLPHGGFVILGEI